jgi:hypothetical protein
MEHEAALALDRPAHQHGAARGGLRGRGLEFGQNLLQIDPRRRPIQPQAHGVVRPVGADQDDGVLEPGVADAGHGHQQPPDQGLEIVHTPIIGTEAGRRKAAHSSGGGWRRAPQRLSGR